MPRCKRVDTRERGERDTQQDNGERQEQWGMCDMLRALTSIFPALLWMAPACAAEPAAAQKTVSTPAGAAKILNHADLDWSRAIVKDGVRRLTLHGDPRQSGPFVQRVIFPATFRGAAHTHPVDLHVLIIRGRSRVGFSADVSDSGTALGASGYAFIPAHQLHWEAADEETEVQLSGTGPLVMADR